VLVLFRPPENEEPQETMTGTVWGEMAVPSSPRGRLDPSLVLLEGESRSMSAANGSGAGGDTRVFGGGGSLSRSRGGSLLSWRGVVLARWLDPAPPWVKLGIVLLPVDDHFQSLSTVEAWLGFPGCPESVWGRSTLGAVPHPLYNKTLPAS
jgi:hypothetical protein